MLLAVKLIPLLLLVAIGFLIGRVLGVKSQDIGRLALYVLSPAVVFKGFSAPTCTKGRWRRCRSRCSCCAPIALVAHVLAEGYGATGASASPPSPPPRQTGFFGIPACLVLIGPQALPFVVLVSFGATLYENSWGFSWWRAPRPPSAGRLRRVLRYPGLHACWLGIAVQSRPRHPAGLGPGDRQPAGRGLFGGGDDDRRVGAGGGARLAVDFGFTAFAFAWKFLAWPAAALAFVDWTCLAARFWRVGHKVW